ncbi:alpha-ketoacid dehydrogenase subunit beta [Dermacoccus nishinomiyaensis]|uniref:alpha-ketoacid dehydrogenase subunit beta n=1 Tax=Dermacoccus nishinomiyaensis TaxID=1274 RepID=UPI001F50BB5A|nr:alpha-ketoacid dehydrogenase subunit beta [Dermacoccus nishinomiyaensis]MCI0153956.1 alpha-ketoacid dehydrogenase subunit beta [Dermacoccus nishinomiyaensis]
MSGASTSTAPGAEKAAKPKKAPKLSLAKALNAAMHDAMAADDKVVVIGEDVGELGGVFRLTDGLKKEFGERVIDPPLAESGIVGSAVGLAMRGYRPIVEIQFDGFVYPAFDQIVSQVSKVHNRTEGAVKLPMVIRIPFGGGIGAVEHHSESNEAYFAHTAGLRVVVCSRPVDAYWMMRQAIDSDDPVIFFEPKRRYHEPSPDQLDLAAGPARGLFEAEVLREGTDLTLLAYGPMVRTCLDVAAAAEAEGRSLEVIDLRTLSPIDEETICESVRKTGRAVIVHEAARSYGVGAELAALLQERCFYSLEAPVQRVTGYDIPYPPSRHEREYLPGLDRILDAVDASFSF